MEIIRTWDPHSLDILELAPGEMLDATVVFKTIKMIAAIRQEFLVLDPAQVYQSKEDSDCLQLVQGEISYAEAAGQQVLAPVIEDLHWILAVINPSDRTVKYYDDASPCRAIRERHHELVKGLLGDDETGARPWPLWTYSVQLCPQQLVGSNDCGVSAFLNAMHLVQDPNRTDILLRAPTPRSLYWLLGRVVMVGLCRTEEVEERAGMAANAILDAITVERDAADDQAHADQILCLEDVLSRTEELRQSCLSSTTVEADVKQAMEIVGEVMEYLAGHCKMEKFQCTVL